MKGTLHILEEHSLPADALQKKAPSGTHIESGIPGHFYWPFFFDQSHALDSTLGPR